MMAEKTLTRSQGPVVENDQAKRQAALSESLVARLNDQLDAATEVGAERSRARRRDRRYSYRKSNLAATVEHPSGGAAKIKVFARDLSSGGLSFLHTNFIYPGSTCGVTMSRKDGEAVLVTGPVVHCRHIQGAWHESSIQFAKRLDPLLFVADIPAGGAGEGPAAELSALAGRVLFVDDSQLDHRLLAHFIRGSQIALRCASTLEEASSAVRGNAYDILLCDLNLGGRDGLEIVKQSRDAGFCGPIVIVTAENRGDRLAQCKAAGVSHVLPKPYQQRALLQLLGRLHEQVGALVSSEALYSSIDEEPDTKELLDGYVKDAKALASRLQAAIVEGNVATAREICLSFKGTAGGYGFIPLQVAAEAAVTALDATMSIDESRAPLRKLELMCGRLALRTNVARNCPEKMA